MIKTVNVDFTRDLGKQVKAVNGVTNGPIVGRVDLSEFYRELGIPCVRLHDTEGSGPDGRYHVDISRIFPNFDADENDPANYWFEHTDQYLQSIQAVGADIIYRMGESIDHSIVKRFAKPPKDFDKWVRICLHIIDHYNGGWANGFHMNIQYWEFWNEPEGGLADGGAQPMWYGGTFAQALELYEKWSKAVKAYDPNLKVGGMSFMYWHNYAEEFVKYCRENDCPLDFVSFHHYATVMWWLKEQGKMVDDTLAKYGYSHVERVIGEWQLLYVDEDYKGIYWDAIADRVHHTKTFKKIFENQKNHIGASFCCNFLLTLNELNIDIANYYDMQLNTWCGMFDYAAEPQKTYYAFYAYGQLLKNARNRVAVESDYQYLIAGTGENEGMLLLSNFDDDYGRTELNFHGTDKYRQARVYVIDEHHKLDEVQSLAVSGNDLKLNLDIEKFSVVLVKFS